MIRGLLDDQEALLEIFDDLTPAQLIILIAERDRRRGVQWDSVPPEPDSQDAG